MSIRVQINRRMLNSLLTFYRDKVMEKYPYRVPTPATALEMERYLNVLQENMSRRETNPAWKIPIKLVVDYQRMNVDVDITDPSVIDLLD